MTNHLPLKVSKDEVSGWSFEWDADALVLQAKEGLPEDMDAVYVGCLPVEIEGHEQEVGLLGLPCGPATWQGQGGGAGGACSPMQQQHGRCTGGAGAAGGGPAPPLPAPFDRSKNAAGPACLPALRGVLSCVLQEVTQQLLAEFNCHPVFLGTELKTNFYKSERRRLGSVVGSGGLC